MAKKIPKKKEEPKDKQIIKKTLARMLELPKEIALNLPLISMTGNEELGIENYKGVIEYTEERIRLNTSCGVLKIEGKKLLLKQITTESMVVTGYIRKLEFLL